MEHIFMLHYPGITALACTVFAICFYVFIIRTQYKTHKSANRKDTVIAEDIKWNMTSFFNKTAMDADDYFHFLSLYLDELKHKEKTFWKLTITFFIAILVFSILPVTQPFGIIIPELLPKVFFTDSALLLAGMFIVISLIHADKLRSVGLLCQKMLKRAPRIARADDSDTLDNEGSFPTWKMATLITWVMYGSLVSVNLFIHYSYTAIIYDLY